MGQEYKEITEQICSKPGYYFEGDLDIIIEHLQGIITSHPDYCKISMHIETGYGHDGGETEIVFRGTRLETDKEHEAREVFLRELKIKRMEEAEITVKRMEEQDIKEYARLKKKFEK